MIGRNAASRRRRRPTCGALFTRNTELRKCPEINKGQHHPVVSAQEITHGSILFSSKPLSNIKNSNITKTAQAGQGKDQIGIRYGNGSVAN